MNSSAFLFIVLQIVALSSSISRASQSPSPSSNGQPDNKSQQAAALNTVDTSRDQPKMGLEPRASDQSFVRDIVERLHSLDADIGRLIFNSTSMYAPTDQAIAQNEPKGGEKFTAVLNDLDALQDEIGALVANATRTRQYNIMVRLRPLNNILYRIRHNLHLMRNSLVAINTVSGLEKLGNSVLDSTLQAFMRPDANLNDEIGDDGNYDINLDKPEANTTAANATSIMVAPMAPNLVRSSVAPSSTTTQSTTTTTTQPPSSSTTTTTTTTTTTPPPATSPSTSTSITTTTTTSTTPKPPTSRRTTQRSQTRRPNNHRNNRRSSTLKPTSTTQANVAAPATRS